MGQCLWSVGFCDECPGVSIFAAVFVASLCPEDRADCGAAVWSRTVDDGASYTPLGYETLERKLSVVIRSCVLGRTWLPVFEQFKYPVEFLLDANNIGVGSGAARRSGQKQVESVLSYLSSFDRASRD